MLKRRLWVEARHHRLTPGGACGSVRSGRMASLVFTAYIFGVAALLGPPGCSHAATPPGIDPSSSPPPIAEAVLPLPPSSQWTATASAVENEQYPPAAAIDGRWDTRWSSPPSDNHWIQIDLGAIASLQGALLTWENAFASHYRIEVSLDAAAWKTVYETTAGDGQDDFVYFPRVAGRYVRVTGVERATSWGTSLREIRWFGPEAAPTITVDEHAAPDGRLLEGTADAATSAARIVIDLRQPLPISGVRIEWGDAAAARVGLETSGDGQSWTELDRLARATPPFDLLLAGAAAPVRYLRLSLDTPDGRAATVRALQLRGTGEERTPLLGYSNAALKSPRGRYPLHLLKEQVYFTVVGVPREADKALLDEYGNLEPFRQGPVIMPMLLNASGLQTAAAADKIEHALVDRYLPIPQAAFVSDGVRTTVEPIALGDVGRAVTLVRYRLQNEANAPRIGSLVLALRPAQINPPWQFGGLAPLDHVRVEPLAGGRWLLSANAAPVLVSLTPPSAVLSAAFDGRDVERLLELGTPGWQDAGNVSEVSDPGHLASAALRYDYQLAPGEQRAVVVAVPVHRKVGDVDAAVSLYGAGDIYAQALQATVQRWHSVLDRVGFEVGDQEVSDTLRAQLGYILVNENGEALQPGSRNYNRAWMRDGSMMADALMRLGIFDDGRRYLDWYAERILPDGLVPPILNPDGTVNTGFGSNLEYDSQGQYVHFVMKYFRLTGDREWLTRHYDAMRRALRFAEHLRETTLSPAYRAGDPQRERYVGLLPPSISHEGFSQPAHSLWDNFWVLRGWLDGRDAARALDHPAEAQWCQEQYDALLHSVLASIRLTAAQEKVSWIVSAADGPGPDPTSISIGIEPCGLGAELPADLLCSTFDTYYRDTVRPRLAAGAVFAYTPYEWRNLTSFAALDQVERAEELLGFLLDGMRPRPWRQFAEVVNSRPRLAVYFGDMPHTWVGSDFVQAVTGMVALDETDHLSLLAGVPERWLRGRGVRVRDYPTRYGKLTFEAQTDGDGLHLRLGPGLNADTPLRVRVPKPLRSISAQLNGRPVAVDAGGWVDLPSQRGDVVLSGGAGESRRTSEP
jgi:hypothetical protein